MAALPIPAVESAPEDSSEHVVCAVCGADQPVRLFEKHGLTIVRCRPCGLAYVDPRPSWSEVARIYRDVTYYRNDNECDFGYGDYLGEQRELLLPLFEQRVAGIERLHPKRGRLLDVGCATGVLLDVARARGWQVEGVDVSEFAVAHCRERGLTVHHGLLENVRLPAEHFDVVVMDDTIEHLPDPRRTLLELHRVIAPGGLLTINTCDEGGLLRRVMGRHWFHYKPLEHLFYFDRRNLARLLEDTGFTVLSTELSGKIVTLRYLCQRLRTYSPLGARVALATLGRLPGARRPFFMPIGEFAMFARRR
ncbi:MAG TPA: class I SAM-dependent methyltransferase [Candidatus Binatia bacterium]